MILQAKSNQSLYYLLIAYAFFAFLMPLTTGLVAVLGLLSFLAVLLLNDSDLLCFLAFSVCFTGASGLTALFLSIYAAVLALIILKYLVLSIKGKDKKRVKFIYATVCLLAILTLYGLILTKFHFYKLGQSIGLILTIAVVYLVEKVDFKKLVLILSLGLISSTILSLIAYFCGVTTYPPFISDASTKFRFGGYFSNINALAMYCSLCQTFILALMLLKKLNIKRYLPILLIITLIGLLTFSKTFILLTMLSYMLAVIIGFAKSNNKKQYIKFLVIGVIGLAILTVVFRGYIIAIIKRFLDDSSYSGGVLNVATTGRVDIWKSYIDKWTSSPLYMLFGCGITADNINERTTHNIYLSILYKFGIVGTILLVGCVIWILKSKRVSRNIATYLPIILIMTNGLSEDITCSLYTSLPILISLLFIVCSGEKKSTEDK